MAVWRIVIFSFFTVSLFGVSDSEEMDPESLFKAWNYTTDENLKEELVDVWDLDLEILEVQEYWYRRGLGGRFVWVLFKIENSEGHKVDLNDFFDQSAWKVIENEGGFSLELVNGDSEEFDCGFKNLGRNGKSELDLRSYFSIKKRDYVVFYGIVSW